MVNVTVVAGDDIHYVKKSVNMTITVNLIPTEIIGDDKITVEIDNYIKPDISINSTKGPVSGNISFIISDPSIVGYDAVQGFKGLKTGNTTVNASYSGDDKYAASYKIINIEVTLINTNLTVEPDSLDLTVGDNAKINATVVPGGAGDARFKSNNESVVSVDGDGNVVAVGFGNATITVSAGDGINYTVVSVDVPVSVKKIVPNLTVEPDSLDLTVGDNAKINATLIPGDAGTISFKSSDDNIVTVDNDGKVNATGKGNATITVSFAGNDKYTPVNATVTINVKDKPVPKENVTMSIVAPSITVGSDAVVTVSFTPSDATGNVSVGGKTVKVDGGVAEVVISNLGVGNHTLPVIYSGDDNFNPAESSVIITVNPKSKENVTMIIDAPEITEGQNATLNVTLPADATGTVTASIGAKKYTAKLVNGTATITIPDLTAGKYTIPVNYSGDDKYNPADQSVNLTVRDAKSDIITAPDVTKYFGGPERFVVSVTDYKGNPLADKSVTIVINGASYTRITDVNGSANIPLGLNSGVYNVLSTLDNQSVESVVTILSTVNGTDVVKMYRNATQYHATFLDTNGKYLTDGTVVTFNINGIMYERKISGGKGQSGLNINLPQGKYIITAINPVNGEMATNNITVLPTLVDNKDIIKYYKNGTQYTVKVLGNDGKAVGAGENVTFNINGVFYTRQTDASGIAKLTINLPPSNYIITAEYKGCSVANNITVLPVLNATDITMKYLDGTQFKANLVDGQGRPYAGQSVTFNINGVFYNRVTDSSGQAKLNIRLLPGEYIITSSYNGSNIANKITITA